MNRCVSPAVLGALSALASLSEVIPVSAQTTGTESGASAGLQEVADLTGGYDAWKAADLQKTQPTATS